ncbi:MAG: ATP phosphoribosyltransferase [Pseudomonadota bacterium]
MITIALSKGRIFEESMPLLEEAGILPTEEPGSSRKLIIPSHQPDVRFLLVRASDVPTYVARGAADIGIAGLDVLLEHPTEGLYQPLDLQIGRCRMAVAAPENFDYPNNLKGIARVKVATKYVNTTRRHFAEKGLHVDIIKLYGSMELAPLVGLADVIVDLVSSGKTLAENHLRVVEELMPISSRLIIHKTALKLKSAQIDPLLTSLERAVAQRAAA